MNQILDYVQNNNSSKSRGSDNIVRVFAILLILFAVALIGVVLYGMVVNNENISQEVAQITYANISIDVSDTQATISVTHDKPIKKLIYSWNESSERTVKGSEKYIEETIDVPAGENVLHVKAIDENDVETTYDEEVFSEQGLDIIYPVIELKVTDDSKLKIIATDETTLDFITYRWNEEDEQTIYADEDGKKIETEIEILKGENDLTVVAVDGSSNTTTETKSFIGLMKPEIKVTLSSDGSRINIKATHDNGIESVAFNFNNADYNVDIGTETPDSIEFYQDLQIGYNRIVVKVKSVDGTETTFDGECNYGSAEENTNQPEDASQSENSSNE